MPKNSPAKSRALRIPLDSYRHDSLARFRNWCTLAAVAIGVAWLLVGFLNPAASANRYSPGPVSRAHQHLGCASCHDSSAPLSDATLFSSWKQQDKSGNQLWHRKSDNLCKACHPVSGSNQSVSTASLGLPADNVFQVIPVSPHSLNQKIEAVGSCASCHCEHRGADVLPSQTDNASCVNCHQNLAEFRLHDKFAIAANVTDFASNHPSFRSLETDKGVLKFSHDLHLSPGLVRDGERKDLVKTLDHYPDSSGRLAGFTDSAGKIQLQCKYCHQSTAESTIGTASSLPAATLTGGKFMTMPTYEESCQVCHPINAIPKSGMGFVSELSIEHGATPQKILNDLRVYFSLEAIAPAALKESLADVNVSTPAMAPTRLWEIESSQDKIAEKGIPQDVIQQAANHLRTTCFHCHLPSEMDSGQGIPVVRVMKAEQKSDETLRDSPVVNSVWFQHGRFDHAAHRDVNCAHCHKMNGGKNELFDTGRDAADDKPMIENLESCIACHQNKSKVESTARPGPVNCAACHTYHGGGNRQ